MSCCSSLTAHRTVGAALRGRPLPDIKISEVGLGHARGSDSFDWLLRFNEGAATEGRPYSTCLGNLTSSQLDFGAKRGR